MITTISQIIADFLYINDIVDEEKRARIQYGFQTIISTLLSFIIVIAGGLLFNVLDISIIFLMIFVFLRRFTGGYHADSYLKCQIIFIFIYSIIVLMTICFENNYNLCKVEAFLTLFVSNIIVIGYSPVEHKNKPMCSSQKNRNKIISILSTAFLSIGATVVNIWNTRIFLAINFTLFAVAILILVAKIEQKGENYEVIN